MESLPFGFSSMKDFVVKYKNLCKILVLVFFAALRERIAVADVPLPFRGASIGLITAGLMALAFMGFSGLIKA